MKAKGIVKILVPKLIENNFIVHYYQSKTTSSKYLKLDFRCMLWNKNCGSSRKEKNILIDLM